jgi:hypothetical protein
VPQQILKVREDRLDLDDQQDPLDRVPGEDVDGASVAEDVECELGHDLPASGS